MTTATANESRRCSSCLVKTDDLQDDNRCPECSAFWKAWCTPKPKPQAPDEDHYVAACGNCSTTGRYCMGTRNGRPWSNTGFTCFRCGGEGWQIRRKPRRK